MNKQLLTKHIQPFLERYQNPTLEAQESFKDRAERVEYYQAWSKERLLKMTEDDFYEFLAKLWAMLIWGNKKYVADKLISDNGFKHLKESLANLVWGADPIDIRWDKFRKGIKGMGPAMASEILCHVHPDDYIIWNRTALIGLGYLEETGLPKYNYQLTGKVYVKLIRVMKEIVIELHKAGMTDATLLKAE